MHGTQTRSVDTPEMRHAGREPLSLALMDARNHTLRWFAALEAAGQGLTTGSGRTSALWRLGHAGWFQEHWIARNVQRQRGTRADASRPKLGSILPEADALFAVPGAGPLPDAQTVRQYLFDTLETSLELLAGVTDDEDDALYFYRLALLREDALVERLAELAQSAGIDTGLIAPLPARPPRAPLWFPATRRALGSLPGGLVPDAERWAHEVALPEFEIDAQAVSWAQYIEFVEDGGYDDKRHWSEAGWAWVQAGARRTPRHVDQMRGGVLQRRFGKPMRVPLALPVVHVSAYEAEAWCHWAGRRLPSEAEWEAAAQLGATQGFRWGEVREWMAGTLRPYPGAPAAASPGQVPIEAGRRALRGASFATRGRLRSVHARDGRRADGDGGFVGFRTCAI